MWNIYEWLALSDTTSQMMGPPDFEDNPIPTWQEFSEDYEPHFFSDEEPDKGRSYIIELNGEGIGHVNYNDIDRETNTVELDIWLGASRFTGKGYGADAVNTLCQYLAENMGCKRFILQPSARNKNAIRAYEKSGFRITNDLPRNYKPDYWDAVVMEKKVENL